MFLKSIEPTKVTLTDGTELSMLFSLRAAARIEEELEKPYIEVVQNILGKDINGVPCTPMSVSDQAVVIACLLQECGQDVSVEDLMTLHMTDFTILCNGAIYELFLKSAKSKKKAAEVSP